MKKITQAIVAFLLFLFSLPAFSQVDQFLADSLKRMAESDKYVRQLVDSAFQKHGKKSSAWKSAWNHVQLTDKKHNTALKNILDRMNKYPAKDIAGEEGAHHFWILVLHQDADTALQKRALGFMKMAYENNQVEPGDYAYLVDRVKINSGEKQVYGTQCIYDSKKKAYIPLPIADSSHVDERRQEVQFPPLSDYLRILNDPKKVKY